jgi:hypothetical protein
MYVQFGVHWLICLYQVMYFIAANIVSVVLFKILTRYGLAEVDVTAAMVNCAVQ